MSDRREVVLPKEIGVDVVEDVLEDLSFEVSADLVEAALEGVDVVRSDGVDLMEPFCKDMFINVLVLIVAASGSIPAVQWQKHRTAHSVSRKARMLRMP